MRKRYLAFALISVIALVWILVLLGSLPQVDNPSGKPESIADENRVPTSAYIELPEQNIVDAADGPMFAKSDDPEQLRWRLENFEGRLIDRNDLATRAVSEGKPWIGESLRSMFENPEESWRWKNYCIQHMADLAINQSDPSDITFLFEASAHGNPQIAEAGLFNLGRVAKQLPAYRQSVADFLMKVIQSGEDPILRVSALRGLSTAEVSFDHQVLFDLVSDYDEDLMIRVASLQAIRAVKAELNADRKELINRLSMHNNPHIERAATAALEGHLDERENN